MANKVKPIEVKKLANGDFAVRWSNKPKKWCLIQKQNEVMFQFIVMCMID